MRGQIVERDANDFRLRIIAVHQLLPTPGKVLLGAPRGHFHMPPPGAGLKEHKEGAGAVALVLIIIPLRLTRLGSQRLAYFSDQLIGTLIKAHHGKARIIRLRIEIQHVFHAPDKLCTDSRDTPLVL